MSRSFRMGVLLLALAATLICPPVLTAADEKTEKQVDKKVENKAENKVDDSCAVCGAKHQLEEDVPWLKMSADFRFRAIWDENRTLSNGAQHVRAWTRYRARVGASITPVENVRFNIRAVTEPRHFCRPHEIEDQWIREEVLFDQFNIEWSNALDLPLKFTVGRQDMKLGSGWLVIEGTPRDGTRTFFFDAIRATYEAKDIQTTFDVVYLRNHANSSWFMRPFWDSDLDLIEHNETGVILYASNKSVEDTTIDGYFIYKHDDRVLAAGNNADIYTLGARVAGDIDKNWKYHTEIAPQWGQKDGVNICALGGIAELGYFFNDPLKNNVRVVYEYRSGDSNVNGAFDPLWGRFPVYGIFGQWQNLFNDYLTGLETLGSQASNFHRVSFGWSFSPCEKATINTDYHLYFADRNPLGATANFTRDGDFRGQSVATILNYKFNEHVSGHLIGEIFAPGNYYSNARNDLAMFVRYELSVAW